MAGRKTVPSKHRQVRKIAVKLHPFWTSKQGNWDWKKACFKYAEGTQQIFGNLYFSLFLSYIYKKNVFKKFQSFQIMKKKKTKNLCLYFAQSTERKETYLRNYALGVVAIKIKAKWEEKVFGYRIGLSKLVSPLASSPSLPTINLGDYGFLVFFFFFFLPSFLPARTLTHLSTRGLRVLHSERIWVGKVLNLSNIYS